MLKGVDISNHNGMDYLSLPEYQAADFAIVQAVDPPLPYPPTRTREQAARTKFDGKYLGYYLWLWNSGDFEADLAAKLALIDQQPDMRLWLDVEDTSAKFSQDRCNRALEILDQWCTDRGLPPAGVYSGDWYIRDHMGGWFPADRMYWLADYSLPPELFPSRPAHQWTDKPIDQNVMLETEIVSMTQPDTSVCQPYKDAIETGVNRLQIELERKTAAGKPAAIRRNVLSEIAQGLYAALQQ